MTTFVCARFLQTVIRHKQREQKDPTVRGQKGDVCWGGGAVSRPPRQVRWVASVAVWCWSDWPLLLGSGVDWTRRHIIELQSYKPTRAPIRLQVWPERPVLESGVFWGWLLRMAQQHRYHCHCRQHHLLRGKQGSRVHGLARWDPVLLQGLLRQPDPPPYLQHYLHRSSLSWVWVLGQLVWFSVSVSCVAATITSRLFLHPHHEHEGRAPPTHTHHSNSIFVRTFIGIIHSSAFYPNPNPPLTKTQFYPEP